MSVLKEILGVIHADPVLGNNKVPIYDIEVPVNNTNIKKMLVYDFTPFSNDGVVRQDLFSAMLKSTSKAEAIELSERLCSILITVGDKPLTMLVRQSNQTGGGTFYNGDTKLHTVQIQLSLTSDARRVN